MFLYEKWLGKTFLFALFSYVRCCSRCFVWVGSESKLMGSYWSCTSTHLYCFLSLFLFKNDRVLQNPSPPVTAGHSALEPKAADQMDQSALV